MTLRDDIKGELAAAYALGIAEGERRALNRLVPEDISLNLASAQQLESAVGGGCPPVSAQQLQQREGSRCRGRLPSRFKAWRPFSLSA
jgi:hypothetical protein